jgi:RNA polymerase sigma-70 factor (ECF subfamily)
MDAASRQTPAGGALRGGIRFACAAGMARTSRRERFLSLVDRYLGQLYNFVRREIAYDTADGQLPRDSITVEDVVDEVVVRAWREFSEETTPRAFRARLIHLALEQLAGEIRRTREQAGRVILGPDDEVETADEVLPLVDEMTPEQIAESREMRRFITRTLNSLPAEWRRVFVLHAVEDLPLTDVARITGLSRPDVRRALDQAREYLRQRLIETGFAPGPPAAGAAERIFSVSHDLDVPGDYRASLGRKVESADRNAAAVAG